LQNVLDASGDLRTATGVLQTSLENAQADLVLFGEELKKTGKFDEKPLVRRLETVDQKLKRISTSAQIVNDLIDNVFRGGTTDAQVIQAQAKLTAGSLGKEFQQAIADSLTGALSPDEYDATLVVLGNELSKTLANAVKDAHIKPEDAAAWVQPLIDSYVSKIDDPKLRESMRALLTASIPDLVAGLTAVNNAEETAAALEALKVQIDAFAADNPFILNVGSDAQKAILDVGLTQDELQNWIDSNPLLFDNLEFPDQVTLALGMEAAKNAAQEALNKKPLMIPWGLTLAQTEAIASGGGSADTMERRVESLQQQMQINLDRGGPIFMSLAFDPTATSTTAASGALDLDLDIKAEWKARNVKLPAAQFTGADTSALNLALGLAAGVSKYTWIVKSAMIALALTAKRTFDRTLEAHSPSKLFERAGRTITDGLAAGITSGTSDVVSAVQTMTQKTMDGFHQSGLGAALAEGFNIPSLPPADGSAWQMIPTTLTRPDPTPASGTPGLLTVDQVNMMFDKMVEAIKPDVNIEQTFNEKVDSRAIATDVAWRLT
jgi:hypothetical protein